MLCVWCLRTSTRSLGAMAAHWFSVVQGYRIPPKVVGSSPADFDIFWSKFEHLRINSHGDIAVFLLLHIVQRNGRHGVKYVPSRLIVVPIESSDSQLSFESIGVIIRPFLTELYRSERWTMVISRRILPTLRREELGEGYESLRHLYYDDCRLHTCHYEVLEGAIPMES